MDFNFTAEQEQLRDAVRRYVEKDYTFEHRRKIVNGGGGDRAAYAAWSELGLAGLCVSEAYGGSGLGAVESMIVMEELGRGIVLEPIAQTTLCVVQLHTFAPEAIKQIWLPTIARGEKLVVLAHQERGARYEWRKCQAEAMQASDGFSVSGGKSVVPFGDAADAFLLPALMSGKLALFLIERNSSGVSTRGYGCQDGTRAADVKFHNAPARLITTDGEAAMQLAVDWGIAGVCAYAIGVMENTLALTVDYLNTRKQFGVALSTFQALRHRVADMKLQLELARSMSYFAHMKLDSPAAERTRAVSQAKVQLGQSMRLIGQQGVQLHGGIGLTDEYVMSHYFKSLTQLEMSFGDTLHHLGEVSARMQDTAGVFA